MFYFKTVSQYSIVDSSGLQDYCPSPEVNKNEDDCHIGDMFGCITPVTSSCDANASLAHHENTSSSSPALQSHTRLIPATRVSSMTVMKATFPDPTSLLLGRRMLATQSLLLVNRNIRSSNNRKDWEFNSKTSIISTTYMQPTIACRAAVEMAVVEMGAIGMRNRVAQRRIS